MNAKSKFFISVLFALCFFSACNNGSNTTTAKGADSTKIKNRNYDTIENKFNTSVLKSVDSLQMVINNMTTKVKSIKLNGNADIDFANIMNEYHQATVDMSLQEVKSGTDAGIKSLAKEIIRNQMSEQSRFGNIAKDIKLIKHIGGNKKLSEKMAELNVSINAAEMTQNIDKDYVNLMIEHYHREIEIANYEVAYGMNSELKQMAQKIINDRTKEISLFKNWLSVSK